MSNRKSIENINNACKEFRKLTKHLTDNKVRKFAMKDYYIVEYALIQACDHRNVNINHVKRIIDFENCFKYPNNVTENKYYPKV